MTATNVEPGTTGTSETILRAEDVTMRFGGLTAVDSVNFTVHRGEIMGLIGPNGAGKTTFFNCLTGMYLPTSGRVVFDGAVLPPKPRKVVLAGMARTFQNIRLFGNMTALENVMVGRYCRTTTGPFTSIIRRPEVPPGRGGGTPALAGAARLRRSRPHHRPPGPQPPVRGPASAGDRPGAGHGPEAHPARRADGRDEPAGDAAGRGADLPDP